MSFLVLILAAFFAMNMRRSGMSPAFAAPYGAGVSGHKFIITHQVVRKILSLWVISPLISLVVTYLLLTLIN
jgi:phosphate/sulfate permease